MTEKIIKFFHEFDPPTATAQQRQFFKNGKTALTPAAKKAAAIWQAIAEKYRPEKPIEGPVRVNLIVSWQKKGLAEVKPRITKPDSDNLAKLILDAMTKARFWLDDSQVYDLQVIKFNAPFGGLAATITEADTKGKPE